MSKLALATAVVALALAASPAAAQLAPAAGYFSQSKSEAILGGQSRLAAIMAQQSGRPLAQSAAPSPAGYSVPAMRAVLPVYRGTASPDRPDVFNSVALPIERTSLDRRWRKVANSPVGANSAAYAASLAGRSAIEKLDSVNRYVNGRVRFVDDSRQYGVEDHWTAAADTLRRAQGDCEDYAIAKLQLLRRAGFADKDLYLVILRDALRRADHAVLVARADNRLLVLDNGTNRLVDSSEMPDYRPIFTFSGDRVWTHGYRRELPQVELASNETAQPRITLSAASLLTAMPATLR